MIECLRSIGVVVDERARMHENVAFIDGRTLWHGSLNILSHRDTSESMLRVESSAACEQIASFVVGRRWVIVAVEFWRRSAACLHGRVVFRHRKPSWRNVACHEAIQRSKSTGDQVVSALGTSRPPRRSCSFAHGPAGLVNEHSVRETGITTRGCWLIKYGLNQFCLH